MLCGEGRVPRLREVVLPNPYSVMFSGGGFPLSSCCFGLITELVTPFIINPLTLCLSSEPQQNNSDLGKGIGLCVCVVGVGGVLLLSLLNHCPFRILQPIVLTIRNNLQMFIYNKSLSMHTSDIPDQANVVNLLSTDPAVFHQSLIFPNYAMVSPILIVISMVVMYLSIGWAVFVICGICVLLLSL